jgi:hypothetical protein
MRLQGVIGPRRAGPPGGNTGLWNGELLHEIKHLHLMLLTNPE